jgi:hypothetical protein
MRAPSLNAFGAAVVAAGAAVAAVVGAGCAVPPHAAATSPAMIAAVQVRLGSPLNIFSPSMR